MKTKLGISVEIFAAAIFFVALFGGFTPVILLAGYALLMEEDEWLKKSAVKAVALLIIINIGLYFIGLLPDVLGWISSILHLFKANLSYSLVTNILNIFSGALSIIKELLFVILGIMALKKETLSIPVVDSVIAKIFPAE